MITQENIPYTADEIKAMVKTCEKYNKALEKAKELMGKGYDVLMPEIFPELKESKDERIRKTIYGWIHTQPSEFFDNGFSKEEMLAWVEEQADKDKLIRELGEYKVKYTQKVLQEDLNKNTESQSQPKFKVRDWIVDDKTPNDVFYVIEVLEEIYKVIDIDGDDYHIPHCKADKQFHLWTIDDAKKGDILVVDGVWIVEFDKKMTDGCQWKDTSILTSVVYDMDDDICTLGSHTFYEEIWPASKEDIDLFKKKRNEYLASNSHDESNFNVGDKVTIEGDDTIYTICSIDLESCWLTHEGRGRGWAKLDSLKHYVEQ